MNYKHNVFVTKQQWSNTNFHYEYWIGKKFFKKSSGLFWFFFPLTNHNHHEQHFFFNLFSMVAFSLTQSNYLMSKSLESSHLKFIAKYFFISLIAGTIMAV